MAIKVKSRAKPGRSRSAPEHRAKADARKAARLAKVRDALELRIAGWTMRQIAAELKINEATVGNWIDEAHGLIVAEPSERLRQMELDRLDLLFQVWWPKALGGVDPQGRPIPPDGWATSQVLQITSMRWRLQGLGAPTQIDITSKGEQIGQGTGLSGLLEAARAGKVPDAEVIEEGQDAGRRPDQAPKRG